VKDHEKALQYAKDVVNDTQALMSNSNSAPIFSHPIGRVSLQFKKFAQMTYYLLGKNVGRVFNPKNPGERKQGLKTLAYIAGAHGAMAGVVGLPGLEALKIGLMLFSAFGGTDMEWEDFEEEVRKNIAARLGETPADAITYGVTRAIPFGMGFDLNSRMGLDSLIVFGEPRSNDEEGWKVFIVDQATGPFGRTLFDMGKGTSAVMSGDFSEVHRMIPFKALADVAQAAKGGVEGTMNTQDMILKTIGLQSDRQADANRARGVDIRERQANAAERNELVNGYIQATSKDELRDYLRRIQRFNQRAGINGQRPITTKGLNEIRARNRAYYQD
jgi:hypothetical protein